MPDHVWFEWKIFGWILPFVYNRYKIANKKLLFFKVSVAIFISFSSSLITIDPFSYFFSRCLPKNIRSKCQYPEMSRPKNLKIILVLNLFFRYWLNIQSFLSFENLFNPKSDRVALAFLHLCTINKMSTLKLFFCSALNIQVSLIRYENLQSPFQNN